MTTASTTASAPNDPLLQDWQDQLGALRERARSLVIPLTHVERVRTPAAGAWSVDQVLEHLTTFNGLYVVVMQRALTVQATRASSSHSAWKPTFMGRMLVKASDPSSTRRMPSPRRSRPGPIVGAHALARFEESVSNICTLMRSADGVDLRSVRFPSPFTALVRLNLGDGFAICVTHTARHVAQIERTIDAIR